MASHSTRQYQPVSTRETSAGDALSVRVYNEFADTLNNAHYHANCHKLRSQICFPSWKSVDANTDEYIIGVFAMMEFPDNFNQILWTIGHKRIAGSGGDNTLWKLKTTSDPYRGPVEVFDGDFQSFDGFSNSIRTQSDSHAVTHSYLKLPYAPFGTGVTYLLLSATNSSGTARAEITTIDAKPVLR